MVFLVFLHETVCRAGIRLIVSIQIQSTGETGKFRHDIMKFRDLSVEAVRVPELHRNISHHKLRLFVAAVIDPVHLDAADVQYLRQI